MKKADETQVGGAHYKAMEYEHWNFVVHAELDYFCGQITKYVSRYRRKNGLQDLQKARHFLVKLTELVVEGYEPRRRRSWLSRLFEKLRPDEFIATHSETRRIVTRYIEANGIQGYAGSIILWVSCCGGNEKALSIALMNLDALIETLQQPGDPAEATSSYVNQDGDEGRPSPLVGTLGGQ